MRYNLAYVVLLVLLAITTTGWVVTATLRDRPLVVSAQAAPEAAIASGAPVVPLPPLPAETIDVLVAARDLPVGTMLSRDNLKTAVKTKKVSRDSLPPVIVTNVEELVDKLLCRPVREEETFNPSDLTMGQNLVLYDGDDMVSIQVAAAQAAAGLIGPGSRVNVLATLRVGNKVRAFPLLVNVLVVAVDASTVDSKGGTFANLNTVLVAAKVNEKQALALSLAKSRGCSIELLLRHPSKSEDADKAYNIESVIELLAGEQTGEASPGAGTGEEKPAAPPVVVPPFTAPAPRPVGGVR
ncbi:hypothetical protein FTUN_3536 [Frigoriglobus tundricola]|uniref:SAF domain-containing protein n=2 Tax=Frigoriglobus tundricola TaxID=2774151 RepID=A0A6M5YSN5_9BACT|nr:hypothetical protein FTUN_3536 [Frigoriglobus tundricola]